MLVDVECILVVVKLVPVDKMLIPNVEVVMLTVAMVMQVCVKLMLGDALCMSVVKKLSSLDAMCMLVVEKLLSSWYQLTKC